MNKIKIFPFILAFCCITFSCLAQKDPLPRSTPEAEGISSEGILSMINALEANVNMVHSFMLVKNGKVVAEGWWDPYKKEDPHVLFSLSKSFTSAAIGFAVKENLLNIDDKVISFFPDALPEEPSEYLKAMRVKDLLTMTTGQRHDTYGAMESAKDKNLVKAFFAIPVEHKPGTLFIYNTGATYMLSAILQKVSGEKLVDYLKPRLFEPLGIAAPKWNESVEGVNFGGFGLHLPTEAIAKFGQLYLQKGNWNGKQLLSEDWIKESSARQVSNGSDPTSFWDQGYGYQFWQNINHGYRADGAFGQFSFILPEHEMVLAMTSGTGDMKSVMDLVWEHLLPAVNNKPLPVNTEALNKLLKKQDNLSLAPVVGKNTSPLASKVSGKTYQFEDNSIGLKSVSFSFDKKNPFAIFHTEQNTDTIFFGNGTWKNGHTNLMKDFTYDRSMEKFKIASTAAWTSNDTFETFVSYNETHLMTMLKFKFAGNILVFEGDRNAGFGPTKLPRLIGELKQDKGLTIKAP